MRDLIAALSARPDPAIVFLAADGERLELTGRVAGNWVYKTAGLLSELEVGEDTALGILCPPPAHLHWRPLAAALAAWSLAAPVSLLSPHAEPPGGDWVALRPEQLGSSQPLVDDAAAEVLVYATGALALSAEAPAGCIDYNSAVRAYPDVTALSAPDQLDLVDITGAAHRIPVPGTTADAGGSTAAATGAVLVSGLPRTPEEWSQLLSTLISGTVVLTDIVEEAELQTRLSGEQQVHGTIGAWTK